MQDSVITTESNMGFKNISQLQNISENQSINVEPIEVNENILGRIDELNADSKLSRLMNWKYKVKI